MGGDLFRNADLREELLSVSALDGLAQFLPDFHQGEDGAEYVEVAIVDAGEVAHEVVVGWDKDFMPGAAIVIQVPYCNIIYTSRRIIVAKPLG